MDKLRTLTRAEYRVEIAKIIESAGCPAYGYGGDFVYLLDFGTGHYKFGMSSDLDKRLRAHFAKHCFYSVVRTWSAPDAHRELESALKWYAISKGTLTRFRGSCEIIKTDNIQEYIDFVSATAPNLIAVSASARRERQAIVDAAAAKVAAVAEAERQRIIEMSSINIKYWDPDSWDPTMRQWIYYNEHDVHGAPRPKGPNL